MSEIEKRANELASWPVHVAIVDENKAVIAEAVVPAGAPVIIGSDAGVTVPITGRADLGHVEVCETRADGVWVHVADDAAFKGEIVIDGAAVSLQGRFADAKSQHPRLTSPVRVVSPKVMLRVGSVAVLLNRDESL